MEKRKLTLYVKGQFETGPIQGTKEKRGGVLEEVTLKGSAAIKTFNGLDPSKWSLEVHGPDSAYICSRADMSKDGVFDVSLLKDAAGLRANVEGEFTLHLEPGVGTHLHKAEKAKKLSFRVVGISYEENYLKQMQGNLKDGDFDSMDTFPKVAGYTLS